MLRKLRDEYRPSIIQKLQQDFHASYRNLHNDRDRSIKFLNHFYLFNGLSKYYDQVKEKHKAG